MERILDNVTIYVYLDLLPLALSYPSRRAR